MDTLLPHKTPLDVVRSVHVRKGYTGMGNTNWFVRKKMIMTIKDSGGNLVCFIKTNSAHFIDSHHTFRLVKYIFIFVQKL